MPAICTPVVIQLSTVFGETANWRATSVVFKNSTFYVQFRLGHSGAKADHHAGDPGRGDGPYTFTVRMFTITSQPCAYGITYQ